MSPLLYRLSYAASKEMAWGACLCDPGTHNDDGFLRPPHQYHIMGCQEAGAPNASIRVGSQGAGQRRLYTKWAMSALEQGAGQRRPYMKWGERCRHWNRA